MEAAIAQLARAAGRGTLARVCSHFPERLGAVTAAATGRGRAAGPRRPHRGAVRIGRPAMAQLARAAGWGSLIWVVNDSPNGYGALTGRPGRAASVRRPGGFSGVSPERPRARVAAAIAHLGRAEGTGRSVRTPCAFPWPEGEVTAPPWVVVVKKGRKIACCWRTLRVPKQHGGKAQPRRGLPANRSVHSMLQAGARIPLRGALPR